MKRWLPVGSKNPSWKNLHRSNAGNNIEGRRVTGLKALSWISSIFIVVPVVILTISPGSGTHTFIFVLFLTSHTLLSLYTYFKKEWAILYTNLFFVALDLIGIYIRLVEPLDFLH